MALFGRKKRAVRESDLEGFELPSFSASALNTLQVLRSEEGDATDVAAALAPDPGLTVRVLRMVNSAGFGARRPVDDLAHAVQLVGRASLESLVISAAARDALPTEVSGLDLSSFWAEASQRAAWARALARDLAPEHASLAFAAALLSNMAVPLLAQQRGKPYAEILARSGAGDGALFELEIDAFGWSHAEVGAWMCERWELPQVMADFVRGHHDEGPSPCPVALASLLEGVDPEKDAPQVAALVAERTGADEEETLERMREALASAGAEALP